MPDLVGHGFLDVIVESDGGSGTDLLLQEVVPDQVVSFLWPDQLAQPAS